MGRSSSTPRTRSSRHTRRVPACGRSPTGGRPRSRVGWASSTAGSSRMRSRHWPARTVQRSDLVADGRIMPLADLAIPGAHNVSNALAAIAVGPPVRPRARAIRAAASAFTGVEHRLEPVATIDGVRFINDSQGTQPDAVMAALRAFEPPIVLIAGGRAKGIDLSALAPVVAERASAAVLIGESGPDLESEFRAAGLASDRAGTGSRDRRRPRRCDRPRGARGVRGRDRDGPAQPGRGQLRHVRRLRGPRPGVQGLPWPGWPRPTTEEVTGEPQPADPAARAPPPPGSDPSRAGTRTATEAARTTTDRSIARPRTGRRSRAGAAPSGGSGTRPTT